MAKRLNTATETAACRLPILSTELRAACRPSSVDCSSAATAARANKRRFVNLLQQLGSAALLHAFAHLSLRQLDWKIVALMRSWLRDNPLDLNSLGLDWPLNASERYFGEDLIRQLMVWFGVKHPHDVRFVRIYAGEEHDCVGAAEKRNFSGFVFREMGRVFEVGRHV